MRERERHRRYAAAARKIRTRPGEPTKAAMINALVGLRDHIEKQCLVRRKERLSGRAWAKAGAAIGLAHRLRGRR